MTTGIPLNTITNKPTYLGYPTTQFVTCNLDECDGILRDGEFWLGGVGGGIPFKMLNKYRKKAKWHKKEQKKRIRIPLNTSKMKDYRKCKWGQRFELSRREYDAQKQVRRARCAREKEHFIQKLKDSGLEELPQKEHKQISDSIVDYYKAIHNLSTPVRKHTTTHVKIINIYKITDTKTISIVDCNHEHGYTVIFFIDKVKRRILTIMQTSKLTMAYVAYGICRINGFRKMLKQFISQENT